MTTRMMADKVVFIAGGAQGIAAQVATRLARQGAFLSIVDRDLDALRSLEESLGAVHLTTQADVTDTDSLDRAVRRTIDRFGRIDVVFANAGIGSASTVAASDTEDLVRIVDVNLNGVIRTVKATLPEAIRNSGYILLMSSAAALKNVPRANAYAAAKSGVEAFGGALRLEVAHKGVAVGVAHPAWVSTAMITGAGTRAGESQSLPWPFNIVTSVEDCADQIVEAISRRRRKVYVPSSLVITDVLRWLTTGPLWDWYMASRAVTTTDKLEAATPAATQKPGVVSTRANA